MEKHQRKGLHDEWPTFSRLCQPSRACDFLEFGELTFCERQAEESREIRLVTEGKRCTRG